MLSSAVELVEVSKVFPGGITAVDGISLAVAHERIVALLGPSGCGKTTTLRLINRLEEPSAGRVLVRGREVSQLRPELLRRSIGYVIQEGGLLPHLSVSANVAIVPQLLRWPRQRVRRRVAEVLELVGLPETRFGRRMPAKLSGGQRQRVGVARALAADPDILLMDEPFGALDPGTREALQDEFLRLQARLRKVVLIVTHDIKEAGKLSDDIVLMDHGRIVQQGTLRDLLLRPAGERVRSFLGKQAPALTLEALRLQHVLDDVGRAAAAASAITVAPEMSLGRVLAVLAGVPPEACVLVNAQTEAFYNAGVIRERILEDLRLAESTATGQENAFFGASGGHASSSGVKT
jgi:osmoprotectant transport system ATP-binding protein